MVRAEVEARNVRRSGVIGIMMDTKELMMKVYAEGNLIRQCEFHLQDPFSLYSGSETQSC